MPETLSPLKVNSEPGILSGFFIVSLALFNMSIFAKLINKSKVNKNRHRFFDKLTQTNLQDLQP